MRPLAEEVILINGPTYQLIVYGRPPVSPKWRKSPF